MFIRSLALLVFALAAWPSRAQAQDRLFVGDRGLGTFGHFGDTLSSNPDVAGQPLAGGRYRVVPDGLSGVQVADLESGQHFTLPFTFAALADRLVADPVRPRVFVRRAGQPVVAIDLPSGAARALFTPPSSAAVDMHYAAGAERLFVFVQTGVSGAGSAELAVIDARGGAVVRTFPAFPGVGVLLVTPDGGRVYFVATADASLTALDVASGRVTRSAPIAPLDMVLDEFSGRLFVRHVGVLPATTISAFDLDLNPIGTAALGGCARVAASPHTGRVYVVDELAESGGVAERMTAFAADGALIDSRVVGRYSRPVCDGLALLTAPGAPRGIAASVSGRDVTLTWTNVGAASGFVLEAGIAPGRTDATLFAGPDTRVTLSGVPPGTYYVRVRGTNDFGGGAPSTEIRIVVP